MKKLAAVLKQKLEGAARLAVLGIGSDLRGDDAAGIIAARQIKKNNCFKTSSPQIEVFIGQTTPENLTSEIKRFKPSHLIIIDSADINAQPGQIEIIEPQDITGNSFSTHSLSLKVMIDYLLHSLPDLKVIFIGIQPKNLDMTNKISKEVSRTIKELTATIDNSLRC